MKPVLVLCLGNEVLSDDSFGFHVFNRIADSYAEEGPTEVIYSSIAGFSLLELLRERKRVLVIDAITTGAKPGTVHFFPAGLLTPSRHLINSHQINLPSAIQLGRQLGLEMPEAIDVLAVEAQDIETLSEEMTEPVEQALDPVCHRIYEWSLANTEELKLHVSRKTGALAF